MTIEEFITELFCRVDDTRLEGPIHPQAKLIPNELVVIVFFIRLNKDVGNVPFIGGLIFFSMKFKTTFLTKLCRM